MKLSSEKSLTPTKPGMAHRRSCMTKSCWGGDSIKRKSTRNSYPQIWTTAGRACCARGGSAFHTPTCM